MVNPLIVRSGDRVPLPLPINSLIRMTNPMGEFLYSGTPRDGIARLLPAVPVLPSEAHNDSRFHQRIPRTCR